MSYKKDIKNKLEHIIGNLEMLEQKINIIEINIKELNKELILNSKYKVEIKELKEEIERYKIALTKTSIENKERVKSWLRSEE